MATFRYRVKNKEGRELAGTVESDTEQTAAAQLRNMGYFVLEIRRIRTYNPLVTLSRWAIKPLLGGASTRQMATFFRQLHTMVKAGMTINQALASMSTQGGAGHVLRKVAQESLKHINAGCRLSDAFSRHPWVFSQLHISLIRAGEESGTLDIVLGRLADYLEHEHAIRQRLRVLTFYPKILILAVIFVPTLPTLLFSGFGAYAHQTLKVLIPALIIVFAIWSLHRLALQFAPYKYMLDIAKLAIPKIGSIVRMLAFSRFYGVVATMFGAGVPIAEAIDWGATATGNIYLMSRLKVAVPLVRQGMRVSEALERTRVLPPTALDIIRTGEQAGNLETMLNKAAEYGENEAEVAISQTSVTAGVLLLLGVAIYIASVVVRFYGSHYTKIMNQF